MILILEEYLDLLEAKTVNKFIAYMQEIGSPVTVFVKPDFVASEESESKLLAKYREKANEAAMALDVTHRAAELLSEDGEIASMGQIDDTVELHADFHQKYMGSHEVGCTCVECLSRKENTSEDL